MMYVGNPVIKAGVSNSHGITIGFMKEWLSIFNPEMLWSHA
jgi:hypothetical protein